MKVLKKSSLKKKVITRFMVNLRSRHPSHQNLKKILPRMPFRSVVRLGSDWPGDGLPRIEINSVQSIKNSSNKLLMKQCFTRASVKTSMWCKGTENPKALGFPLVAKSLFGSRGNGNSLISNQGELDRWMRGKTLSNYIFEKFYNYSKEYRLHVTEDGCFYTCRKMLKREFKDNPNSWQRHNDNCSWFVESNPDFDRPTSWNDIVKECVKAIKAVGLDIGCLDVIVQSNTDSKGRKREYVDFCILETNSAPSMADITEQKYLTEIPRLLNKKRLNNNR